MTVADAFEVAGAVLASLGGGGFIVWKLADQLGTRWATRFAHELKAAQEDKVQATQARIEEGLRKLESALEHQNFLLGRLTSAEIDAIVESWHAASFCATTLNSSRRSDASNTLEELQLTTDALGLAFNALVSASGKHEPFLSDEINEALDSVRKAAMAELQQIQTEPKFEGTWWRDALANRAAAKEALGRLKELVRQRLAELRGGDW